jgi:hypothetical protein
MSQLSIDSIQSDSPKKYLSVPKVAERWHCDEKLVYQEIAAKRLSGLRIGKKLLRVSLEEVARYEREYQTSREAA